MLITMLRLGAAIALFPLVQGSASVRSGCLTRDGSEANMVRNQRVSLHLGNNAKLFDLAGLTRSDTNLIQPVTMDSLCDLAARAINRDLRLPEGTDQGIHMITFGKFYLVAPRYTGREFPPTWLLDSSLTKVVYRTS
jgi:hypothetical protein